MPRKSEAAHLTIVPAGQDTTTRIARIRTPARMAPAPAEAWRDIVGSLPAAHFRASDGPLLARYCELIAMAESPDLSIDDHLKVCRVMASLATRLRLAPSTRGHHRTTARQRMSGGRDWETDLDD